MNVKMYKYLYKKMNDDIRDSEMLCDWSKAAKEEGQTELAEKLSVSFASVNRWENGLFEPTMKVKRKLRELFKEAGIEEE